MARAVVQSTNFPAVVFGENNGKIQGSQKRMTVTMICNVQASSGRLRSFSGLRDALGDIRGRSTGCDFFSKTAAPISVQRRKPSRRVAVAMFERFTGQATKVIISAQEEARRLGHNFVGTEQILLGLIVEGNGIAAKVLHSMGIDLKDARVEVEKIIGRGNGFVAVEIPFTPRAKRVLELSLEEARLRTPVKGKYEVGSEHLLLGLLHEGEGVATRVLENLGADPSNIRAEVLRTVGESTKAVGGGSSADKMATLEDDGTNSTRLGTGVHSIVITYDNNSTVCIEKEGCSIQVKVQF